MKKRIKSIEKFEKFEIRNLRSIRGGEYWDTWYVDSQTQQGSRDHQCPNGNILVEK
ncbi:hypothetical protein SanaruYs_11180 [Chryseotalea sanaruensis]|uniref:Uncharacterized protein n=1 Tax=Chryseotalea sanaruensis TaxID=2482724 RepID=A0A401U7N3_9BACT|nr:hypothetical protein [Chryseotalea sanaruensis]GCC50899.1 hypothetical protein SanaruYs_11180 [Chryseotalea sanaruensis]